MIDNVYQRFLENHQLPPHYLQQSFAHFQILINDVVQTLKQQSSVVLAINGCQGSGKTTLARFLQTVFEYEHQLNVACVSIDDFYYTKQQRFQLAHQVHPLLATRGVPGTHDVQLAIKTISALTAQELNTVTIPRFDKAQDDRATILQEKHSPCDIVIFEGWCIGAKAQDNQQLAQPVNNLERQQDKDAIFRRYVNHQLRDVYPPLFDLIDIHCMLKAPSFVTVYDWRLKQEKKLIQQQLSAYNSDSTSDTKNNLSIMSDEKIREFIQHFQRITEHMLEERPNHMHHCYHLDKNQKIVNEQHHPLTATDV